MEGLLDWKGCEGRFVCENATLTQGPEIDAALKTLGLSFDPFFQDNEDMRVPRSSFITDWDDGTIQQPCFDLLHNYLFNVLWEVLHRTFDQFIITRVNEKFRLMLYVPVHRSMR